MMIAHGGAADVTAWASVAALLAGGDRVLSYTPLHLSGQRRHFLGDRGCTSGPCRGGPGETEAAS